MVEHFFRLPFLNKSFIEKQKYFLLFQTNSFDKNNFKTYILYEPVKIYKLYNKTECLDFLKKIDTLKQKYFIAGFCSYELGYLFENKFNNIKLSDDFPLLYFLLFEDYIQFNHITGEFNKQTNDLILSEKDKIINQNYKIISPELNENFNDYNSKIDIIKKNIVEGNTYQINYTLKYKFKFKGFPYDMYIDLLNNQSVEYNSFFKLDNEFILSFSPELFYRINNNKIYMQPMKGTMKRGYNIETDELKRKELFLSEKNRAENLMIVDLIRNDLGKISETGTVKVTELYKIKKYQTLFQMVSDIKSVLKNSISYYDIFKNLFPSGSVTGAPKIRSMQIINKLESDNRNVYCGAIGFIKNNSSVFNIPIRTVYINQNTGKSEMGTGSGIVYDSQAEDEYNELKLKYKFLNSVYSEFELIETLLYDNNKLFFLTEHLERMRNSAEYFEFEFDYYYIFNKILEFSEKLDSSKYKIRLLLNKTGELKIENEILKQDNKTKKVCVSEIQSDKTNIFLYHKTTNRKFYNKQLFECKKKGFYDIIFFNTDNELTEGSFNNIIIEINNKKFTPPVESGLLNGVYRKYLLNKKKVFIKKLYKKDLINSDNKIYLCNSVRGLIKVEI